MSSRNSTHLTSSGPTLDLYIPEILLRTSCVEHDARLDEACFAVPNMYLEGMFHIGICNKRAKKAGMNGQIDRSSLVRGTPPRVKHGK